MPRQLPQPTDKSQKKTKTKTKTKKDQPVQIPRAGMTTIQTVGILGGTGASAFGFMRWWFGDLWLKEFARKAFDWIYPLLYPEIEWWQILRRFTYWGLRSHFQQQGPTYFLYFASVVLTAIPGGFFVWRRAIKPRFFCKTDPVTDECIKEDEDCEGECDLEDNPELEDGMDEDVVYCEKQRQIIEGQVVEVQVCLTEAARKTIEDSKRKREQEAEKLRKEAELKASVTPDKAHPEEQNTATNAPTVPSKKTTDLHKRRNEKEEVKAPKRSKVEKEEASHAPGEEVVMAQSGEHIDLKENCDCEEDAALTVHKTLLTMADATPAGSKFKGNSKRQSVQTRKSARVTDTEACEHSMDVEVNENGEQINDASNGYVWSRLFK